MNGLNQVSINPIRLIITFIQMKFSFEKNKISIFYLGAAWDDWGNKSNSTYAALNGLSLRPNEESVT